MTITSTHGSQLRTVIARGLMTVAAMAATAPALAQVQTIAAAPDTGPPRLDGLKTGPFGLTVGPGGGLALQVERNGNIRPLPPLPAGEPQPAPDPRDFEGSWYGDQYLDAFEIKNDLYGNYVPFNQAGREVMDRRLIAMDQRRPYITPALICRPSGAPRDMIHIPFLIVQTARKIDLFSQANRTVWQIALDASIAAPVDLKSYSGRSVGHWDGNTLVVQTTGFKYRLYLSFRGTPLSPNGKLTDRIRKVYTDHWFLEDVTTVDDPTFYQRPWSYVRTYSWRPDYTIQNEYNCETQIGDKTNNATAGYTPEPNDDY